MLEGKLIKFYREKEGFTQGELVQGICSVTHLSKIERGITEYSGEITFLLSKRLKIDLETEVIRYNKLNEKLTEWHEAMIMQRTQEVEILKNEIEQETLKDLPDYLILYRLLLSKYYLFTNQLEKAKQLIFTLNKQEHSLPAYEQNLLKHVLGIYYFLSAQFNDCIQILKSIDQTQYNHHEFYYHLAIAYHSIHSNITSYYYAEKALHYFRRTLNILRIIDTETIMIAQLNAKELHDFEDTKRKYDSLLKLCDACKAQDRKAKLYHNLAFEHSRRKLYREASDIYQTAMRLISTENPHYLTTFESYLSACHKGKLLPETELISLAKEGLQLCKKRNDRRFVDFQLLLYLFQKQEIRYYQYIESTALNHFRDSGYNILVDHYEKKLFHYFLKHNETEKALNLAESLLKGKRSFYDYE
ncbi:helix-turn-helix transcriptional regulator [Bacillus sp. CMF21]|nr:helix-turn-helix transcriptional regulator [Bacillus sp. CMF21]